MKFLEILKALNNEGITLGDVRFSDGMFGMSLNTQAKSDMTLYENGLLEMRYSNDYIDFGDSIEDIIRKLCINFCSCVAGRDYFSREWADLCVKYGIASVETSVTKHYRF